VNTSMASKKRSKKQAEGSEGAKPTLQDIDLDKRRGKFTPFLAPADPSGAAVQKEGGPDAHFRKRW